MNSYVGLSLLVVNIVTFLMYGLDKRKAVKRQWRISEAVLLGIALCGGSVGALLGMKLFHHKTKHWKFKILVPLFVLVHVGLYFVCCEMSF